MYRHSTQSVPITTIDFPFAERLPLLSREAYCLRQRLARALLTDPNVEVRRRLSHLIERANKRFERREKLYRAQAEEKGARRPLPIACNAAASWHWQYVSSNPEGPVALCRAGHGADEDHDVILATGSDGRAWIEVNARDARLIAAAPELLRALEGVMLAYKVLARRYPTDSILNTPDSRLFSLTIWSEAFEALAKAKNQEEEVE